MPLHPRRLAVSAVLGLALLATACSSDDDDSDEPTEEASAEETTSSAEDTTTTVADDAAATDLSEELTPEGTELAIGESATLPHDDGGVVAVTIDSVTAGTPEELAELELQGGETGDLYYVSMTVTNVSAAADAGSYEPGSSSLFAIQDDNQPATPVAEFSTFTPCENESPTELAAGESFATCAIYLASSGVPVTTVQSMAEYDSTPIVWS